MILTASIIAFLIMHHKTKFINMYPNGWREICFYAVGVIFTYPFYIMHLNKGEKPKNAFLLAFLGSGIGTAFGWISEDIL